MRRVIEDLIAQRQQKQHQLQESLNALATELEARRPFFSRRPRLQEKMSEVCRRLCDYVTIQDREWDAQSSNHSTMVFHSLQWKIDKLQAEYSQVRHLLSDFLTLENSLQHLIDTLEEKTPATARAELQAMKERLSVHRYEDFERRFRGSEEEIAARLQRYMPRFQGREPILDVGCGRGEFLELLRSAGQAAVGIDTSPTMLTAAREKGLDARLVDAVEFLRGLEDSSWGGIFAAQVIEHMPPDYLREFVQQAQRVLQPGAALVLETINPLSLYALSRIFFLDVTHCWPLHPEYMRYLLETSGFSSVEIEYCDALDGERLREMPADQPGALVYNQNVDRLNQLLYSPAGYAACGVKA